MHAGLNDGAEDERMSRGHQVRIAVEIAEGGLGRSACGDAAEQLAHELGLPLVVQDPGSTQFDLLLSVRGDRLELRQTGRTAPGGISVDFVAWGRGARFVGNRRQPLARAVGLPGSDVTLVDATAGLGRDCFRLASLGCMVTAVERSPVLGALLRDGLRRALTIPKLAEVVERRLNLVVGDAKTVLTEMRGDAAPDVVYLDPMFSPKTGATALAKKEMRVLRQLVGGDDDVAELLDVARRAARRRVVVKRWLRAQPLGDEPTMTYKGKIARYDVYVCGG